MGVECTFVHILERARHLIPGLTLNFLSVLFLIHLKMVFLLSKNYLLLLTITCESSALVANAISGVVNSVFKNLQSKPSEIFQ